ncbi:MAG: GNAT family N-acetyltransferase [Candidatus Marinimicrobia bacterium]|nr:GNAT family N-acetyltransferase [Candidatus Neomarinimicrobiota bacterium]MCF7850723.1 GNAT family N-acetyltransferase [Candidatus Neomarinimicrobiota bacterium]
MGIESAYILSSKLDESHLELIHQKLSQESYWAFGRDKETVINSFQQSLGLGLLEKQTGQLSGFCRVISDYSTVAYLLDFFIMDDQRGQGLGKFMLETVLSYPRLQNVKRWMLATKDAHAFYGQFGFNTIAQPEFFMEKWVDGGGESNEC